MARGRACLVMLLAILATHLCAAELPRADAQIAPVFGGVPTSLVAELRGQPALILFWRSDCAPCLFELSHLAEFRAAAHPHRLLLIGLQSAEELQSAMARLGVPRTDAWRATEDPADVLTAFGGAPPRLPLAVVVDGAGNLCARRPGALGPVTIRKMLDGCER